MDENYIFICISFFAHKIFANTDTEKKPVCNAKGLNIYSVNGVLTLESGSIQEIKNLKIDAEEARSLGNAYENLSKIRSLIFSSDLYSKINTHPTEIISYNYIYNQTKLSEDFAEVLAQKYMESGKSELEAWIEVAKVRQGYKLFSLAIDFSSPELYLPSLTDSDFVRFINESRDLENSDVQKIFDPIKEDLKNGKKVLLITHSQGGLFGSRVNTKILEDNDLKVTPPVFSNYPNFNYSAKDFYKNLQIASPSAVAPNWITINEDGVIKPLRLLFSVVPATHSLIREDQRSGRNHGLIDTYLSNKLVKNIENSPDYGELSTASDVFLKKVLKLVEEMPSNCNIPELSNYKVEVENGDYEGKARVRITFPKEQWIDYHKEPLKSGSLYDFRGSIPFEKDSNGDYFVSFEQVNINPKVNLEENDYVASYWGNYNDKYGEMGFFHINNVSIKSCKEQSCCQPNHVYQVGIDVFGNSRAVCCETGKIFNGNGCYHPYIDPIISGGASCNKTSPSLGYVYGLEWSFPQVQIDSKSTYDFEWYGCPAPDSDADCVPAGKFGAPWYDVPLAHYVRREYRYLKLKTVTYSGFDNKFYMVYHCDKE